MSSSVTAACPFWATVNCGVFRLKINVTTSCNKLLQDRRMPILVPGEGQEPEAVVSESEAVAKQLLTVPAHCKMDLQVKGVPTAVQLDQQEGHAGIATLTQWQGLGDY